MKRGQTGVYATNSIPGESFSAFIPDPLPPRPDIEITPARQRLMARALLACGRLDAITDLLPDTSLFLYAYVRREAVLSSQIEGTQSSLSDLMLFEIDEAPGVPFDDVGEVSNYVAALEHGITRLAEGFPLSNRLLRELHGILLKSGRGASKGPGEFKRSQNWIGGTRPGNAQFVPPPPDEVQSCMAALERYLHDENVANALVKAALAHVQFETIHPFLDGNGRVGRLLIALVLLNDGVLRQPLLYLSLYLKENRENYYQHLDQVRKTGDWESWLDFFLAGVEQTATGAVATARRLITLFEQDASRIRDTAGGTATTLLAFHELQKRPITRINVLAESVNVSYVTASRAINELQKLGIVRELTGKKRERLFAYGAYLDVLNEGAENPL